MRRLSTDLLQIAKKRLTPLPTQPLPLLTHPTGHTDARRRTALEAAQPTQSHPSSARVRAARARQVLRAASHTATAATSTALLPASVPCSCRNPNCEAAHTAQVSNGWLKNAPFFSRAPPARNSRASAAGITPHLSARAAPENFRWVQQHRAAARDWQSAPRAQRAHGVRATHSRRLAERRISMGSDAMPPLPLGRNDRLLEPVTLAWSRRRGARFFTRTSRDLCRLVWWRSYHHSGVQCWKKSRSRYKPQWSNPCK